MRSAQRFTSLAVLAALASAPLAARAHDVTVDGASTEWSTRTPPTNVGLVVRTIDPTGELVWDDALGDTRTDLSMPAPELVADLRRFAVTATPTALSFLAVLGPPPAVGDPAQLQIAIDLDRVSGSGETFFAGFADTTVSPDAEWEFLVQTQRTGGVLTVRVLNTSYATVGTGTIAQAATGVMEISIPWTLLSRTAPAPAMRLTVATFREDTGSGDTRAIGGSSDSNALDALTNYGGPGRTGNTWDEVMDMRVDHYLEVWLDPASGEVIAPLVVARFVPNPPSAGDDEEWFAIHNQTALGLSLEGVKVGDEETIGVGAGAEGMSGFPAGSMIAAGATVVVARSGMAFAAQYGAAADYELLSTDPAAVDLVRYAPWFSTAASSFQLANGGDEILIVDARDTIVDLVTYGSATTLGVNPLTPAPGAGQIAIRSPVTRDSDDTDVDFSSVVGGCDRAEPASCGTCFVCSPLFTCDPAPAGTSCADDDLCDGAEACDGAGVCAPPAAPLDCDDANPCTADSCVAATGCVNAPVAAGTSCADADRCDGDETCDASGTCAAGTPVDCADDDVCTSDVCDPATGACTNPPAPVGTSCADDDLCDGEETCDAEGACVDGSPTVCEDDNPCTTNACDPESGCTFEPVVAGVACDDGNGCTTGDVCNGAGMCAGTADPTCDAGAIDAGADGGSDGGLGGDAAVPLDAGRRDGGADAGPDDGDDDGCDCRAAGARGRRDGTGSLALLAALGVIIAVRRRRR